MKPDITVAYTLEQCWHEVPGGTAVAALEVAARLDREPGIELLAVAGRHRQPPARAYRPQMKVASLPLARPWLYQTWLRANWPKVEAVTGVIDVCHSTTIIPAATDAPMVVTVHDLAFMRWPERFSRHGVATMTRALARVHRRADLVLCSSEHTLDDLLAAGFGRDRLRLVPLGVDRSVATTEQVAEVRLKRHLPERFVLFLGTLEPRKNLPRLIEAVRLLNRDLNEPMALVVVGASGWGPQESTLAELTGDLEILWLGFVTDEELDPIYAAATVMAYPSEWEGFGLPVAEAMVQGTPVVTSRGTSTEEVAGGAAVLVDPFDVADIARGIHEALGAERAGELARSGQLRAMQLTWEATTAQTISAYRELV
jgi:glycosyltransferase involved in cell wall biosynthesis